MARKPSAREKVFLAAGGTAVVLFVLGKWFLAPLLQFSFAAGDRIEEGLDVISAFQDVVAREEGMREEQRALEETLKGYGSFFLPGDTPALAGAVLEARLKEMAGKAGLNIVSGKLLGAAERAPFLEIPLQIVATGSIESLRDFVVLIESSEVFIGIREMNLRSLGGRRPQRPAGRGRAEGADIQATMTVTGLMAS